MYVDHTETWESLLSSLVKHGTVSTPSSRYKDPEKFLKDFKDSMHRSVLYKEYPNSQYIYHGVDPNTKNRHGQYFIIQMVHGFDSNKQAKHLLDTDY